MLKTRAVSHASLIYAAGAMFLSCGRSNIVRKKQVVFRGLLAGARDRDFLQKMLFFERFSRLREDAKWPKHWPAWVVLDLCAEGDFRRFFGALVGRKGFRAQEEARAEDNASVPRTADTSILCACGGSRKNLQVRALAKCCAGQ